MSVSERPGGRSARVREAVFAATLSGLSERGYASLTVEDVAERAGVHKTTIYRRWGTLAQLVAEAVVDLSETTVPVPDTGALESDLHEMARSIVALVTSESGRAIVAALFSDAVRTPEVAAIKREFYAGRYALADVVVQRAVGRGEIQQNVSAADLLAAIAAPIYYRLLVADLPVDRAVADRAAAAALVAARAGVLNA
ncbi:TetR/AcrR family transcriptional regulator [Rhodococcus sp. RD6.2]|uniref:TetR/AcrR family transcriptional regulator n=1 Tax=Rhodococcus sp. RD6.2 TaxID=260936 RepID=UPI00067906D8|nr:TetR/AcrR family transcriptional regulator [Rhodococcus sp. RD6.2]